MRLYLARHGEAGRAASDDLRQLTPAGEAASEAVFRRCAPRIDIPIAGVMASPLIRARETAAIALEKLPVADTALVISEALRPDSGVSGVVALLTAQPRWPLLLVGHQPLLGELLSWFSGDDSLKYSVATSSLFALDLFAVGRDCATLSWSAFP